MVLPTLFSRLSDRLFRPTLNERTLGKHSPIVLVAARQKDSYQLVHGLVATAVAAENNARIVAFYSADRPAGLLRQATSGRRCSGEYDEDAYKAFADDVILLRPSWWDVIRARGAVQRYAASDPTRRDLEFFTISGVRIGDLAFDAFVAGGHAVAVDPVDPDLLSTLLKLSIRALAVRRYLVRRPCRAVIVKDLAYAIGVPGRVAQSLGIDAYAASLAWCDRLSPERPDKDLAHLGYLEELRNLSESERAFARELGAEFLQERLAPGSGGFTVTGVDVWGNGGASSVPASPRTVDATILVAPHSFTDAQHAGGVGLFSDSFSWLEFLHDVAGKTNYHWLIKLHPDQRDTEAGVRKAVEELFANRDNVHVLEASVTHASLLDHGIDLVLTVYGTIALEFPARGIPAVTAKPVNPHSSFSYALHPSSVEDYRATLLERERWTYNIPSEQVAEYAYLHYLVGGPVFLEVGPPTVSDSGESTEGESMIHRAWGELDDAHLGRILQLYRDWVRSGEYTLNRFGALRDGGHRRLLEDYRAARAEGRLGRLPIRVL